MKNLHILIFKATRRLEVFDGETLVKAYPVSLGFAPEGDKEIEGDGKTPEGDFYVYLKNEKSQFYLSLGLSYPNVEDAGRGFTAGIISREEHDAIVNAVGEKRMPPQKTALGGEIFIHGGGCEKDWTAGCVAVENDQMKEIFDLSNVGMKVAIRP